MSSFKARLQEAKVQLAHAEAERDADPLLPLVAKAVSGFDELSTNTILVMVGLPPTTGNARKVARSMRALGYVGIKSRRLPPGGWTDTLCRGWAKTPRRDKRPRSSHDGVAGERTLAGGMGRPPIVENAT
jgi:hypothetical protein